MAEQNIVADIRIGSLISVTGALGGTHHTNLLCELKGIAFRVDGDQVRGVAARGEAGASDNADDDESELDMQVDGPLKARRSALRVCVWTFGVVATFLVSVALLGVGGLFLGGFVVGEAALYCHEKKRWERLS